MPPVYPSRLSITGYDAIESAPDFKPSSLDQGDSASYSDLVETDAGPVSTLESQIFDDLTYLAICLCGTAMAAIVLPGSQYVRHHSKGQFVTLGSPDSDPLYRHTLGRSTGLVVPDTLADARFVTSPQVVSAPHIRFYAGVPILGREGQPLGLLCVMDPLPGDLNDAQLGALVALARQVRTHLELLDVLQDLEQAREAYSNTIAELHEHEQLEMLWESIRVALAEQASLQYSLQRCVEALSFHLDAALVQIWTLNDDENGLHLFASAGLVPPQDSWPRAIPIGQYTIGQIALERKPYHKNNHLDTIDEELPWLQTYKLTSFMGQPLVVQHRLVGVLAIFRQQPFSEPACGALTSIAGSIALSIERKQAEEERIQLQEEVIRSQAAALAELSTPLIPISEHVMVMPLIGKMDERRVAQLMSTLLSGISKNHARIAIIDITGISIVDAAAAEALIGVAKAVKMLGAQVIITGIGPEIAQTLVGLGADLQDIITRSTLQSAIAYAIR